MPDTRVPVSITYSVTMTARESEMTDTGLSISTKGPEKRVTDMQRLSDPVAAGDTIQTLIANPAHNWVMEQIAEKDVEGHLDNHTFDHESLDLSVDHAAPAAVYAAAVYASYEWRYSIPEQLLQWVATDDEPFDGFDAFKRTCQQVLKMAYIEGDAPQSHEGDLTSDDIPDVLFDE